MKTLLLSTFVLAFAACGPAKMPAGTAEFRFSVSSSVKSSPSLKDPLLGTVYGDIFLQEDVSVTGPRKDAVAFGAAEIAAVDLRMAESSTATFVTPSLPPGKYVFLGFFDVDGNGSTSKEPDQGDPVTLALTNTFDIVDGQQTRRSILFELVFN